MLSQYLIGSIGSNTYRQPAQKFYKRVGYLCPYYNQTDRAERHNFDHDYDIHSPFLLPSLLGGRKKGKTITKVVVKSHAFLLDPSDYDVLNDHENDLHDQMTC